MNAFVEELQNGFQSSLSKLSHFRTFSADLSAPWNSIPVRPLSTSPVSPDIWRKIAMPLIEQRWNLMF